MKMPWLHGPLMMAFGDDSNAGGGFESYRDDEDEVIDGDEESDDDNGEGEEDEGESDDDEEEGQGKGFDQNALVEGLIKGLTPALQAHNKPQQMSRADIEKQLGKPELTEDHVRTLFGPEVDAPKVLQVLNTIFNQQQEYLLKASGYAMDGQLEQFRPQIGAMQTMLQQQQQREFATGVMKKFPALKGRGQVVSQAIGMMMQKGYKPASQTAAKRDVASVAARIIKQIDPSFSLKQKQTNQNQFLRPQGGGRGNGGGGGGKKSLIDSVFGPSK